MKVSSFIYLIFLIFFFNSCSNNVEKKSVVKEKDLNLQVKEAYEEGLKSLEEGDVLYAAKNLMK